MSWMKIAAPGMLLVVMGCAVPPPSATIADGAEAPAVDRKAQKGYQLVSWRLEGYLDDLRATEPQRERIHAIKDRLFDDYLRMRAKSKHVPKLALEEWKSEKMDTDRMHAVADEQMDLLRLAMHDLIDAAAETHETLTPRQRDEITAWIEESMED